MSTTSEGITASTITRLKEIAPPGTVVYAVVRNVSKSGMSRQMDFYVIKDNELRYITGHVATILDLRRSDRGVRVTGVGMDMAFATTYALAQALYDDGYALKSEVI